jgi:glutaredoxin 3
MNKAAGAGPAVVIYTSDDCHWCGKAKQYLATRGVAYTEKNVETDEAAGRDAERLSGQRGTPVITVGGQVIVGFQRRALDAALALGAADAATEAALPPAQDALAATLAAGKQAWTPEQQATAADFARIVDRSALCGYLGRKLDYSPANCDHTFRHVDAYLGAHPPAQGPDAARAMLRSLGVVCDCGYAMNLCSG